MRDHQRLPDGPPSVPRWRRAPVVLLYHGFTAEGRDDDPENLFVTLRAFETQLDYLLEHGWRPLDLAGFLAARDGRGGPGKAFLVTIDDGLRSVAQLAAPTLRSRGVPAVVLVPAGLIGETARWLPEPPDEALVDEHELRALAADPLVEVGAHGFDHLDLRGIDPVRLERETSHACEVLRQVAGAPITCFAYPYGAHDAAARQAVARAGCEIAFSVFDDEGPYAISRIDVNATDTLGTLRLKLTPGYRRWWRAAGRAAFLRRHVRRALTHGRRPSARLQGLAR